MDSRGPVKPRQVFTVLVGHRASPTSRMHPLSSVPPIQVCGRFGTPIVAAEPFLPRNPAMRTNSAFSGNLRTMQ